MGDERLRVLSVAADAAALERHAEILESRGFEVVTASDADTARRYLEQYSVDCVLSGYRLPERDGLDFLAEVRRDYPGMPFVLLTSETSTAVVERAVAAGVTDYVPRLLLDISEALLAHRIRRAVAADDVELDEAPPVARYASGRQDTPENSTEDLFDIVRAALGDPVTDDTRVGADDTRTGDDDFVWVPVHATGGPHSSGERASADTDGGTDVHASEGAGTEDDPPNGALFELVERIGRRSDERDRDTIGERRSGLRDESTRAETEASPGAVDTLPSDGSDSGRNGLEALSEEELFDRAESLRERLADLRHTGTNGTDRTGTNDTDRADLRATGGPLDGDADTNPSVRDDDADDSSEEWSTAEDVGHIDTEAELDADADTAQPEEGISGTDTGEATAESIIEETPTGTSLEEGAVANGFAGDGRQVELSQTPGSPSVEEYTKPGNLDLAPGTSVLVQCGSQDDRQEAACADLLQPDQVLDRNVLLIRYRQMSESRLETIASSAARTKVISIGYTQPVPRSVRDSVENIKINNPNDVTRLGIVVTGTIDEWKRFAGETVVCYKPLDVLLRYKSVHSAFRFLHIFLSKLQAGGAIAHFHVDPSAGDPQEINTLKPLFDSVVTIDSVGTHLES